MSGQAGGRGYLIQAVIAVLDALQDRDWSECVLEPMLGADKIDLLLRSASGDRVSQIKSSENAIGAADVGKWARELEGAYPTANQFELRLIGPVTGGAASVTRVGKVDVPLPQALNFKALREQCAHRLDGYLRELGHGATRPSGRELLAEALATRLGQLAASGKILSRTDLQKLLSDWVAELLPPAALRLAASRLPNTGEFLLGRTQELAALFEAWNNDKANVVEIVAPGGVGKTQLIKKWREQLAEQGWLGAERVFDWSFYSQGTSQQGTADNFFSAVFEWLGEPPTSNTLDSWSKGERLVELVRKHRTLLILDGLEPLQHPPGPLAGSLTELSLRSLLQGLAEKNPGLCIVTTREPIAELLSRSEPPHLRIQLHTLEPEAGEALLRAYGIIGSSEDLQQASTDYQGHALALILLATYLRDRDGSSRHINERHRLIVNCGKWSDEVSLIDGAEDYSRHARKVIESYVNWFESDKAADDVSRAAAAILRLMGLFNRPAEKDCLQALRQHRIAGLTDAFFVGDRDQVWSRAVQRLRSAGLLAREMRNAGDQASVGALDCHPLIREHFSKTLNDKCAAAVREGHDVLYQHLQKSVAEESPATISALQPLYQAVYHGCLAGRTEDAIDNVFSARVLRRDSFSWRTLGAVASDLSALACFFERRWDRLRPGLTGMWPSWVFGESGFQLRNLGRLEEAIGPLEHGLTLALELPDEMGAASNAGNLGELHMLRGRLKVAIEYSQQAVALAREAEEFQRSWAVESKHAWLLFQVGRVEESERIFLNLEKWNDQLPQSHRGLHSMPGFWYCQLLLSRLEHFAYGLETCPEPTLLSGACQIIRERATKALVWSKDHASLLDAALDRLSLGRLRVVERLIEKRLEGQWTSAKGGEITPEHFQNAVIGLRRATQVWLLPYALLGRAEYHYTMGDDSRAEADLNELEKLVVHAGMTLFQIDAKVLRARNLILCDPGTAARLIAEAFDAAQLAGYHRRFAEIAQLKNLLSSVGRSRE